jgi:hypothetical protein
LGTDTVAEAVEGESGALQFVFDPSAVVALAAESGVFPRIVKAEGRATVDAVHPAGDGEEIARSGE